MKTKHLLLTLTLLLAVAMQGQTSIPAVFQRTPDVVITPLERHNATLAKGLTKDGVAFTFAQGSGTQAPESLYDYAAKPYLQLYPGNTITISCADTLLGIYWGGEGYWNGHLDLAESYSSGNVYIDLETYGIRSSYWYGKTTELVFTVSEFGWSFGWSGSGVPPFSIYLANHHESITLTDGKIWPDAALLYDFNGNGYKGGWTIDDYANSFAPKSFTCIPGKYFGQNDNLVPNGFMEDVNRDGIIDGGCFNHIGVGGKVGAWSAIDARAVISEDDSYRVEDALLLHNCDLNNDGRADMLQIKGGNGNYYYNILYQQADGSFLTERMEILTEDEYLTQFNPAQWSSTETQNTYGLLFPPSHVSVPMLTGVSLDLAPRRGGIAKSPGMGTRVDAPTKAIDMNADGRIDLVDEAQGIIFYNMGNNKWVRFDAGGEVHTADLNNDGYIDFIYPGVKLTTLIYSGNGTYKHQLLFQNLQVDQTLYVYDFDRDGDVDILVTFSAPANATGYSYTMFFQNDGQGNFTQMEEQDSGDLRLVFAVCQDINGDGYYDLLAFRTEFDNWGNEYIGDEVYVLYGQAGMSFAPAQKLYDANLSTLGLGWDAAWSDLRLDAEDIDNDGKMELWVSLRGSDLWNGYQNTYIYKPQGTVANTAPTAPPQPEIIYENGMMRVSWGDGADAETMTSDLTYALRIGTTSGGNEILTSHANADGSRRDFLDGNMGKNHSYVIDLRSYAPGNIYVSVQTIDAQHTGSAWSQEAVVEHNALAAVFTVDKKQVLISDTMQIFFTAVESSYTHTWDLAGGQEVTALPQSKKIVFSAEGIKTLTHSISAADGTSASYVVNVEVLPVSMQSMTVPENLGSQYSTINIYSDANVFADYNFDGYVDAEYDNTFYKGGAEYAFTRASGIWNTGLQIGNGFWFDYTHNGAADFVYAASGWDEDNSCWDCSFAYMPHNGTNNLTASQSASELSPLHSHRSEGVYIYDIFHDGYFAGISLPDLTNDSYSDAAVRNADGTWEEANFVGLPDGYSNNGQQLECIGVQDFDHNGFVDFVFVDYRTNPIAALVVSLNQGGGVFNTISIPFTQGLANVNNAWDTYDNIDMREPKVADINSDGYLDIVAFRQDKAPYILYNEANERFSAPVVLPLGNSRDFYEHGGQIADVDNNGYPDILIRQRQVSTEGGYTFGVYAYFMDENGIKSHAFLGKQSEGFSVMHLMPDEWIIVGSDEALRVQGTANERPSAPTGLRAVQTEDGLLIEWNAAADDHTPAAQLRYNLSVKHAGQTGNGAFVISPQNGLNANAAAIPTYQYIAANRYFVPISALSAGNYEIQIQAVDLQNAMSLFSDVVSVSIDRAVIDAPTTICSDDEAIVNYMGEDRTGTPQWDFDGGIATGSGFGPYHVTWATPGIKTIALTLGAETFQRTILVDKNETGIALPQYLFEGHTTTLDYLPKDMQAEWQLDYRGQWRTLDENDINGVMKDKLSVKDGVFTVGKNASSDEYLQYTTLKLTLTNASGCTSVMQQPLTILSANEIPQIGIVEPDANGHNEIVWGWTVNTAMFTQVEVLKETNIYNQFVSLGVVPATDGYFTDLSSQTDQRAERYAIVGIMANGVEAPRSNVHQTVHLNINRGLTDNTFNLIWNAYQGTEIATYSILRGASAETLQPLASLSGANTSYTDYAPSAAETYYAIEYYLPEADASAPRRMISSAHSANNRSGRSNIVNRAAANTIVYTQSMTIMSSNNQYSTTAEQPMLLLYAEFKPTNTTVKAAQWEIANGTDLATIDPSSGLLTARAPNNGGVVTVKATAKDGSGATATRQITIAAIQGSTTVDDFYYTIRFLNYDGAVLQSSQVLEGEMPTYNGLTPTKPEDDNYTYEFSGWLPTIVAATADADYTAVFEATEKTVVQPNYLPYDLQASVNGTTVTFSWSVQDLPTYFGIGIYYGSQEVFLGTTMNNNTSLTISSFFEQFGTYTWKLCGANENRQQITEWVDGPSFEIHDPHEGLDQLPLQGVGGPARKILRDGQIFILRGDKIYTITGQEVK